MNYILWSSDFVWYFYYLMYENDIVLPVKQKRDIGIASPAAASVVLAA